MDVRDAEAVQRTVGDLRPLDHLVYAAGVIRRGEEHDPEVFDMVLDMNLNGAMRVAATARPILARGTGTILNIASMLSFFGGSARPRLSRLEGRNSADFLGRGEWTLPSQVISPIRFPFWWATVTAALCR